VRADTPDTIAIDNANEQNRCALLNAPSRTRFVIESIQWEILWNVLLSSALNWRKIQESRLFCGSGNAKGEFTCI
jgi:hypothetical protein